MVNIAVVSVNKNKYSETFIHGQIRLLPAQVHYLYGGYLPIFYNNGKPFLPLLITENLLTRFISRVVKSTDKNIFINAIAHYCTQNNIEAILAHYGPVGVNMVEVSRKTGIPLHVYFHGYDVYRASELNIYGKDYKKVFDQATSLFAVSKEMVEKLALMSAPASKIVYNPCGADTELFKPIDASLNPPIFISVGRFDDTKNHSITIKAFKKVNDQYPDTKLKLIGDGKNKMHCKKLVIELGLSAKVCFCGVLTPKEVALEMAASRVFVLHSVTAADGNKEGAPVSIMEAGATGLPVVATHHAGISDIVLDNETGFLVAENDIEKMALYMKRFIENPFLAKEMGTKAALRINEHFSLKRNVAVIWQTLNASL